MNPSASSKSRWKVPEISALIQEEKSKNHSLPFIALTETWLKSYMSDAQLQIPGYSVSRSDRDARVGGGVLLYSHVNLPVSECNTFDDGTCEGLFCSFSTMKTCVAVAYRPPNASLSSFKALLSFFSVCISSINDDSYDIMMTGDYNLPSIDWQTNCVQSGGTQEVQQSAQHFLAFMSDHLLSQYVMCPTRGNNILDLFITNNNRVVTNDVCKATTMSDHHVVDVMLAYNPLEQDKSAVPKFDENSFRCLDFHQADFSSLRDEIEDTNWSQLRSSCSFEDFPALFTDTLFQICSSHVPHKTVPSGRPKHTNALRRKRNRLKARLNALVNNGAPDDHIRNVRNKVALLQYDIRCTHTKRLNEKESSLQGS